MINARFATIQNIEENITMKKNIRIAIAIFAGIGLLAAAAFLGARLLAPASGLNNPFGGMGPGGVVRAGGGPGAVQVASKINMQPAAEIPQRAPEMNGAVTEVKDNSLMLANVKGAMATMDESGEAKMEFEYDGPAVEVVVTRETQIYLDTTFAGLDMKEKLPDEDQIIKQTLEPSNISEIGSNSMVTVWGYKRGDRLMAEVILLNQPFAARKK
jgi:hypothetical protein